MDDPIVSTDRSSAAILRSGCAYLEGKGIDEFSLNAELLLCDILRSSRAALRLDPSRQLTQTEIQRYRDFLLRRAAHEPLQYILGETEFYGDRIRLSPEVLIPRPDTELLVETVLELFGDRRGTPLVLLDLGTGSGNIAIALAKRLPRTTIDAVDISRSALAVAEENVRHHRLERQITLIQADLSRFRPEDDARRYDAIVSNPPYISEAEYRLLQPEVREFEPAVALTDHADGLTFYRAIAALGRTLLTPAGAIVLEIAYNQGEKVKDILQKAGYSSMRILKDYNGNDRVVHAGSRT
jgi:release factor glutamine methyltransferase